MQSVAVFLATLAVVSAGGLNGYSSQQYTQHAGVVAPVAVAQPALAYAHAAPAVYAHAAPVVAKAVVPAAQSYSFQNRAPAARVAVAAPIYAQAAPVYAQAAPVYAHAAPVATTFAHGPAAVYGNGPVYGNGFARAGPAFF